MELHGSEVVVRFSPFLPDRLLENAIDTFVEEQERGDASPRYGVSVLAGTPEDGEDLLDVVRRIVGSSTLNGKKIAIASGNTLRSQGFQLVADPNAKEPLHHLVGDNPFSEHPRVDLLASLLQERITNPAWKEGSR